MKKYVFVFSTISAISILAIAAQEKESAKPASSTTAATIEHKIVSGDEVQWGPGPAGLPPGAQMAVLDGNPNIRGSFTIRLKTPAGYKIMPHTHPTSERVTVISGAFRLGMGDKFDEAATRDLAPGAFAVLPAGTKHFGTASSESVVQIQSEGPFKIKYVNPADDPRNAKQ